MYEAKRDDYKRVEDESHTSLQQVIAHPALVGARTVQPAHLTTPVFYMQVQYPVHCCALVHPYQPWLLALWREKPASNFSILNFCLSNFGRK